MFKNCCGSSYSLDPFTCRNASLLFPRIERDLFGQSLGNFIAKSKHKEKYWYFSFFP